MSEPVTASRRCPRLINAGHRWFGVRAVTPRSKPSGQFCRVSFTNPFTSRATSHTRRQTHRDGTRLPLSKGSIDHGGPPKILAELEYHETQKLIIEENDPMPRQRGSAA